MQSPAERNPWPLCPQDAFQWWQGHDGGQGRQGRQRRQQSKYGRPAPGKAGFLKWGYPNSWMVYQGTSHENGWFRGTPILGNLQILGRGKPNRYSSCLTEQFCLMLAYYNSIQFTVPKHSCLASGMMGMMPQQVPPLQTMICVFRWTFPKPSWVKRTWSRKINLLVQPFNLQLSPGVGANSKAMMGMMRPPMMGMMPQMMGISAQIAGSGIDAVHSHPVGDL